MTPVDPAELERAIIAWADSTTRLAHLLKDLDLRQVAARPHLTLCPMILPRPRKHCYAAVACCVWVPLAWWLVEPLTLLHLDWF